MKQAGAESPPPLPGDFADQIMRRIADVVPPPMDPAKFGLKVIALAALVALVSSTVLSFTSSHSKRLPELTLFRAEAASFTTISR
ncbi:MAG: hypothetical protein R3F19_17920 [Verrucomicrobiales bacterium]